jgi:uncharacterized protein (TIGR02117 family)
VLALGFWQIENASVAQPTATPRDVQLFIRSNGVHTDLVLPVRSGAHDWRALVPPQHFKRPDSAHTYVSFGWGDRGFYLEVPTWAELTVSAGLKAMSGQGPAAMHITFMPTPTASQSVTPFRVTARQYDAIAQHVRETLTLADGRVQPVSSPWQEEHDALFEAHSAYSPFKTCNEWTRQGLAKAGLPTARWAVFPFAVTRHLPRE